MSRSHKISRKWLDRDDNENVLHKTRTRRLDDYYEMIKEDNEALYSKKELEEIDTLTHEIEELTDKREHLYSF